MAGRGGGSNPPPLSCKGPSFDFLVRSEFHAGADAIDRLVAVQREDDPLVAPIGRRLVAQDIGAADVEPQRVGHVIADAEVRSEEHTSELQSLMRSSYAVFCLKKKKKILQ